MNRDCGGQHDDNAGHEVVIGILKAYSIGSVKKSFNFFFNPYSEKKVVHTNKVGPYKQNKNKTL